MIDALPKLVKTILLIDFENVREIALGSLPSDWQVLIFVGKSQHSIPFEITRDAQQLGNRLEWIKIEGDGRNNLDFHLAFHLGRLANASPSVKFLVLTKDKGFDPLIQHVVARGLKCQRIEKIERVEKTERVEKVEPVERTKRVAPAPARAADPGDPHFDKVCKLLSGIAKNARPRKRRTLLAQVASFFQKKESAEEIARIVDLLVARKLVTESGNTLTYHF